MNVNEVIADISGAHPLDEVNRSQSTNDVNPSALRIAAIRLMRELVKVVNALSESFEGKGEEFRDVVKLGRTHLQDAVQTTLGAEFAAYGAIIGRRSMLLNDVEKLLHELNLGGTAIGNSINASPAYIKAVYPELCAITGLELKPAHNLMAATSSQADFLAVSQAITTLCADLSKIASDLRLMASGPKGGFGEITLEELQNGSSIMPGKVNPVLPEAINQLYFIVSGNNLTIEQCVHAAQLELGVMLPTIADRLIQSMKLAREVIQQFSTKCVATITANPERCKELLDRSTAGITALVPEMGYDKATKMVKDKLKK